MDVLIRTVFIASFFGVFYLFTIDDFSFETFFDMVPAISIVLASVYFVWSIGRVALKKKELNYYLVSNIALVLIATIIFSRFDYYRIVYNMSTSILLSVAYASIYIGLFKVFHDSVLRKVAILFIFGVFVISTYFYTETYIRDNFISNEKIKDIYIEAGAIMERERSLNLLKEIKDCDKVITLFKKRVELDKKLKNDKFMKEILERDYKQ